MGVMKDAVGRRPGQAREARGLVDALCSAAAQEHAAQVRQVQLIAELCASYATLEASGPALPGHERLVRAGGAGTPWVAEHLATELAPKLRLSLVTACLLISDSIDLVVRHPRVWEAARAGRARVWQARQVAAATRTAGLSLEAAGWVDERIEPALGRLAWGRLRRKLAGLIVRADTQLAARRAAEAQAERFVRIRQHGDGTALVVARTDAADAHRLDHALTQLAGQLAQAGHTDEFDVLRAAALGVLARPEHATALLAGPDAPGAEPGAEPGTPARRRRPRATAQLVIHLAPGSAVGRCEELGPVLAHQVKEWLGHDRVVVNPVVDLTDNPAVDSYEVPEPMARVVRWRHPYEVFPWGSRASRGLDLDHTRPFEHGPGAPPGQTCPDNLGPLSRRVHNAKTHAGWRVEQPRPGVFLWTSPLGYRYRVDPDGSHGLPRLDVSHSAVRIDLVWPGAA